MICDLRQVTPSPPNPAGLPKLGPSGQRAARRTAHLKWSLTVVDLQNQQDIETFDAPANGEFYPINSDTTAAFRLTGSTLQGTSKGLAGEMDDLTCTVGSDQSGEGADAHAKERISTNRAGDRTKSTTAGCTHACILGDIRIVAGCACRLLARGDVAVICLLGMTAHLDDGAIVSTAASTSG